jgi:hypothetical protein
MLFKTILSATIAVTSALAAPLEARNVSSSYFTPSNTWQYSVRDGAITATSSLVEIYKSTGNGGKDQTTLVTFTYPAAAKNKQCQLEFHLPANASPAGSNRAAVRSIKSD